MCCKHILKFYPFLLWICQDGISLNIRPSCRSKENRGEIVFLYIALTWLYCVLLMIWNKWGYGQSISNHFRQVPEPEPGPSAHFLKNLVLAKPPLSQLSKRPPCSVGRVQTSVCLIHPSTHPSMLCKPYTVTWETDLGATKQPSWCFQCPSKWIKPPAFSIQCFLSLQRFCGPCTSLLQFPEVSS